MSKFFVEELMSDEEDDPEAAKEGNPEAAEEENRRISKRQMYRSSYVLQV